MNRNDPTSSCLDGGRAADKLKYYVGFSLIPQIGAKRAQKLLNFFDSLENAWKGREVDLARAGIEENIISEIIKARAEFDLDKEMEKIQKEGIGLLTINDKNYPKLLKEIYAPPFLLYIKGEIKEQDEYAIAVVGARKCTDYGKQATEQLCLALAQNKITIVSGLALGIDSFAHHSALVTEGARTIGVMGCGIDSKTIYPTANRNLAGGIIAGRGAIISEYPIGTPPLKQHFPARNRIISGLSLGVLVIEATETSGSLITANCALEQGREVFAVPGSIHNKNSVGPNSLIKRGAKLTENINDILEELHLKSVVQEIEAKEIIPENKEEEKVLKCLELENRHIDEIVALTGIGISDLNALLVNMEMKGMVKGVGGGNYMVMKR